MYDAGLTISCSTGIKAESTLTAGEIADRNATAADVVNQESVVHFGEIVADYARGSIFRGGAAYWEVYSAKTNHFILVGDGTDIVSKAFDWDDMAAGAGADMVHNHSAAGEGGQLDWDNVWSDAVHSHANAGEGGQLDWDNVWSDAVHSHSSAAEGGVVLGPLDSITMADDAWIGIGAGLERIVFDAAGDVAVMGAKFGIGTITIPHGAVGYAKLAIEGTNASAAGPHVQFTTASDDYPLYQILAWEHDNITLYFDAYYDGADRSSDAGSNARIHKRFDKLTFKYDSGIAQGAAITWNDGITLDLTNGRVGFNFAAAAGQVHIDQSVNDAAIPTLVLDQADTSEGFINFIGGARPAITGVTDSLSSVRVEINGVIRRLALYTDA